MNTWIKDVLIPGKCEYVNGFWFCGSTEESSLSIKRRPLEVARNPKNWSRWRYSNYEYFKSNLAKESNTKKLLDLGAGPQHFKDLTRVFNTCAVEFEAVEEIDVVCDITSSLPFLSGQFDIILLSNVLEHISVPEQLLRECLRVLKPGGMLLGTVPFMMGSHQRPHDYFRYTDILLQQLFDATQFKEIEIIPLGRMLDTVEEALHAFFMSFLKLHKSPGLSSTLKYKGVVILQKLSGLVVRLLRYISGDIHTTNEFTQGYGFRVRKG